MAAGQSITPQARIRILVKRLYFFMAPLMAISAVRGGGMMNPTAPPTRRDVSGFCADMTRTSGTSAVLSSRASALGRPLSQRPDGRCVGPYIL